MPTWNHRVVRKRNPTPLDKDDEFYYEIHEAHYNTDGALCAITEDAVSPYGENLESLKWSLEHMLKACDNPILIDGEIEYTPWDDENGEPEI